MKTAILVPCYNRPGYLLPVIEDIARLPEVVGGMPVFLSCDGGPKATQLENIARAQAQLIPNLHCLVRASNYGVGRNRIASHRYLFEECGFDHVFYVEDDVRLTPQALTLILSLNTWLSGRYSNLCTVGSGICCTLTPEEKLKRLDMVEDSGASICNQLISKACWNSMLPLMLEYENKFLNVPYNRLNIRGSRNWIHEQASRLVEPPPDACPVRWDIPKYFAADDVCCGSDGVMALAARLRGISHVTTVVNRAVHIGEYGVNTTDAVWKRWYRDVQMEAFEADATRTDFTI